MTLPQDSRNKWGQHVPKKITDETSWLGENKTTINQRAINKPVKEPEKHAGLIQQGNPLYSDKEYDVSFNNPMYSFKSDSSTDPSNSYSSR